MIRWPVMNTLYPRVHNAMWPGLVGKGPDSEPPIDLDAMLRRQLGWVGHDVWHAHCVQLDDAGIEAVAGRLRDHLAARPDADLDDVDRLTALGARGLSRVEAGDDASGQCA